MNNLFNSKSIYEESFDNTDNMVFNNALGTYNTEDFTIRLAYYIHEKLENLESGVINHKNIDTETLIAYSTFLHETIHWRQHIGSTSGFILSMLSPVRFLTMQSFLKIILSEIGLQKPLIKYYLDNVTTDTPEDILFQNLNNVLNNYHDLKYYKNLVIEPKIISNNEDFLLSYGHSTAYTYINIFDALSSFFTEDKNIEIKTEKLKILIKNQTDSEHHEFNAFKEQNRVVPPLGLKQIFEGQARFIQLQFLYFSNRTLFDMEYFNEKGLLSGVYGVAFEQYLQIIEKKCPPSFNDPLIAIFLLICDLAINPGVAFPMDVGHEDSFFFEAIPGIRFFDLCHSAKDLLEKDSNFTVNHYSKEEYIYISNALCKELLYSSPDEILNNVLSWPKTYSKINDIKNEEYDYSFKDEMLPIRFLLSKFFVFCEDKSKNPEFFCWTGACSTGKNIKDKYLELTEKHKAPFINQKDLDVYTSSHKNISTDRLKVVHENFHVLNILSNIVMQWVEESGDFKHDFMNELTYKHDSDELSELLCEIFKNHFNYDMSLCKQA